MTFLFHYTDKVGWNGIRSQIDWSFRAGQPHDPTRPVGAYFTDISPDPETLRTLHKRLRVPKSKQEYVFNFRDETALVKLNGGSGRDKRIYFSSVDYLVVADRQIYHGPTTDIPQGGL